ncbi:MAG TPA: hypothetical protein VLF69_03995 [Candidatus Saccharimonadales bacterium]|nr:hypothetical protein [Candidatus Saccharimonadales bacterium]
MTDRHIQPIEFFGYKGLFPLLPYETDFGANEFCLALPRGVGFAAVAAALTEHRRLVQEIEQIDHSAAPDHYDAARIRIGGFYAIPSFVVGALDGVFNPLSHSWRANPAGTIRGANRVRYVFQYGSDLPHVLPFLTQSRLAKGLGIVVPDDSDIEELQFTMPLVTSQDHANLFVPAAYADFTAQQMQATLGFHPLHNSPVGLTRTPGLGLPLKEKPCPN